MKEVIYSLIIIFLAFAGFFIASLIRQKLKTHAPLTCPLGADCSAVIRSRFSKFLGIPLTVWGMIYYAFAALGTTASLLLPQLQTGGNAFLLITASMIAFVFSMYLTAIQAFVIKEWCSWCLGSAIVSFLIFLVSAIKLGGMFPLLLAEFRPVVFITFLFGLIIAFGGAIIYTVLFFKFLRDYKLSSTEKEVLISVENVIIIGLGLVIVNGVGLFIPLAGWYVTNPEFILAAIAVLVLSVQTVLEKADIAPRLTDLYDADIIPADDDHSYTRKLAYAGGAVSLVSWAALTLMTFIKFHMSFLALLAFYVLFLVIAVILSQVSEYKLYKRSLNR